MKHYLADARLPRAVRLPGATWHGHIDLTAIELVLAGKRPHTVLDEDHKLYAIVHYSNRPGTTVLALARALGVAEGSVTRYMPAPPAETGTGAP